MKYQEEKLADILEEIKPLNYSHWEEIANNKDVRPLNPDYETYTWLNNNNIVRIFTARDGVTLVGYFIFVVVDHMHYQGWLHADVDIYWIDPAYRKQGIGSEMMKEVETWLQGLGVKQITMMDKVKHSHKSFFEYLGYKPVEQMYEKLI